MKRLPIFIFLVSFMILIYLDGVGADDSQLPPSVTVSSVYWDPVLKSWGNEIGWVFSPAHLAQGANGYTLEVKRKGATSPTALLRYGDEGRLRKVTRFLVEHGRTRRIAESFSGALALSDGFPVPFDYLAPDDPVLRRAKVRKRAGGSAFSRQVERAFREVTYEEALSDGLVKDDVKHLVVGKQLRMIEISIKGTVAVRQLWATGLSWWVYEESPFRKSWLTGIEE